VLAAALPGAEDVERFRPLLPVGYAAGVEAYRRAAAELTVGDLTDHYRGGLRWFHDVFVPQLKRRLAGLSGWDLDDHVAVAAGADTDLITHLVEAVAAREGVRLFPGDWYGFLVGGTQDAGIAWDADARGRLACLCVPSVRDGHVTAEMLRFLSGADACLLNINLFPTLSPEERRSVASALAPVLPKSILSVSFSRGFGLTASQLGVALVPRNHPYLQRFERQWGWSTWFHNALAARAFLAIDLDRMQAVDAERRAWVHDWLRSNGLPVVESGSYYVKAFRPVGDLPDRLRPLVRGDVLRLCFKPPQT
jgi:hypothetical protein